MAPRPALVLAGLLGLVACRSESTGPTTGDPAARPVSNVVAAASAVVKTAKGQPLTLLLAYGSEKKAWIEELARKFEGSGASVASGRAIRIDARAMGSGEAVQSILSGELKPHVFSPASGAYVTLLNRSWLSAAGHTTPISPAGDPVVLSPLVIATWKPMAEALGWPKKALGWKDLIKVNSEPKGWGAHGHAEWGPFKLGHTHPEFSNSGLLSVLAEAYAGAKKTRDLTLADLAKKPTRDFVSGVEKTIVHYGKSTGLFSDKMLERGPSYLSAAVMYENLVIQSYDQKHDTTFPLVAIYPVEGTFWSDHPYAVLDAPWVGAEEREAAQKFLAFLKDKPQQTRALALRGWPAIGGKSDWGFVKLGHTDPTKSNSGMQALLLMTLEHYNKTSGLTVGDLLKPDYQSFIAAVEKGVSKFEASTGTFMTDMIRFGPSNTTSPSCTRTS